MPRFALLVAAIDVALLSGVVSGDAPLIVGGMTHGAANIQALADLGVGNFVWIPKTNVIQDGNTPWDKTHDILADVDACVRNKMHFLISQGRGLGLAIRPGGPEYGGDGNGEMHSAETIREIVRRAGELFAGLHAEELDADLVQSALRPSYRSRIPELYDFTDRAGGRAHFEGELTKLKKLYQGYVPGVEFWPNMCITHHHSAFRIGSDLVIAELLEHLPCTELQLAYLRGGAHQFGSDWGVWVSPWLAGKVPCEDKKLWPAPYAVPGGGHSNSEFRRCLYLAYVSGARVLTAQQSDDLFSYKDPANPAAGYKLAAWGQELKSFWDYARNHKERMKPIVEIAVMVDKDNGWAPGQLWGGWMARDSVWGKLPTDRTDNMLSAYLDVLLPGYHFTKDTWGEKTRIYPGYFASTPVGPFDIVSSDISEQRLSDYRYVVLLGGFEMTPEVLKTLRTYVGQGGTLFVNVDQMRCHEAFVQDRELLGATIAGTRWKTADGKDVIGSRIFGSSKIARKAELRGVTEQEFAELAFCSQDVQPTTAEVVADDGAGNPVLLRNRFGKGTVYLSIPEYMMEGYANLDDSLKFFKAMIRGIGGTGPIDVTAPGSEAPQADISWAASYQGKDSVVAVVANHGESARGVVVRWRGKCAGGAVEVGQSEVTTRSDEGGTAFGVTVPPADVLLLRIRGT